MIKAKLACEIDSLWRSYLANLQKYFEEPVGTFQFAVLAQICDIRKKKYVDLFVSAPKDVQDVCKIFRNNDLSKMSEIKKKAQPKRRWNVIKKNIKKKQNFRKLSDEDSIWCAYAE